MWPGLWTRSVIRPLAGTLASATRLSLTKASFQSSDKELLDTNCGTVQDCDAKICWHLVTNLDLKEWFMQEVAMFAISRKSTCTTSPGTRPAAFTVVLDGQDTVPWTCVAARRFAHAPSPDQQHAARLQVSSTHHEGQLPCQVVAWWD